VSIQDERDLRDRLGGLLNQIEPRPAPVASVVRRGKEIRMRRWISITAGLAVIAAGATLLPGFLQGHTAVPFPPLHYKVTVQPPGKRSEPGLVAQGTINGNRWRVIVQRGPGNGCMPTTHLLTCGAGEPPAAGRTEVSFLSSSVNGTQFVLGSVGARVTRVTVQLGNGSEMQLTPIAFDGKRWVALAAPLLTMGRAVSYDGQTELAYSIPFSSASTGVIFNGWLRPGQVGPARATFTIGSGNISGTPWSAQAYVGPWGVCVTGAGGGSDCIPSPADLVETKSLNSELLCGPTGAANWYGGKVAASVQAVRLRLSDGSAITAHPVRITGGGKLYIVAVPKGVSYVRWTALDAAGRSLGSGTGWRC
jgi:hypothetical protein